MSTAARALALLRVGCGSASATFRPDQREAIEHIVASRGRLLVIQKTGWGKSFVYFIAAKLLREAGLGPTLIVSPLLSLMRNQLDAAKRMGLNADTLHSDNKDEWRAVEQRIAANEVDVLLVSPERFANEHFAAVVLSQIAARIALVVVDEAHCISDWGHDFRPHYRLLERIIRALPSNLRVLATTATANDRVMADLEVALGPNLTTLRGDLARPQLALQTLRLPSQAARLAWLAQYLPTIAGSGIIYTLTIRDAEMVAAWLTSRGILARPYHGQSDDRAALEDALSRNEVKALVATSALGMGFDKPDLGFVVHFQAPGSVVAYYQQVGRAGRGVASARGILLSGAEETAIGDFFIEGAFPTRDEVEAIIGALEAEPEGLSTPALMERVNVAKGRIDKALALLSLESPAPLGKLGAKWQLTATNLGDGFWQRAERLTLLRREEQEQMQRYVRLSEGHMAFLIAALDGVPTPTVEPLPPLPATIDNALGAEAIAFLRQSYLPIKPRKLWPPGGLPHAQASGKISPLAEEGRALCVWGDAGWGEVVRRGWTEGRFDDQLVGACARLIQEDWRPTVAWVTAVPSLRCPGLVPEFAERLAGALGVPFVAALVRTEERPSQRSMSNGSHQARNVDGALEVRGEVPSGPVLLVDDQVDSGWTLTVAAWLLRRGGSGPVWPLALARTGGDE